LIRRIYNSFGNILDVSVKEYVISPGDAAHQQGYGFVTYEDQVGALNALQRGTGLFVEGIAFDCTPSHRSDLQGTRAYPHQVIQHSVHTVPAPGYFSSLNEIPAMRPSLSAREMSIKGNSAYLPPQQSVLSNPVGRPNGLFGQTPSTGLAPSRSIDSFSPNIFSQPSLSCSSFDSLLALNNSNPTHIHRGNLGFVGNTMDRSALQENEVPSMLPTFYQNPPARLSDLNAWHPLFASNSDEEMTLNSLNVSATPQTQNMSFYGCH
jgi:hypothetical protein